MAVINPKKLLPPSKYLSTADRMSSAYDKMVDDVLNYEIKEKVIKVDKILKNKTLQSKKKQKEDKEEKKNQERIKKEKKLETKQGLKVPKLMSVSIPGTNILDSIKRFFVYSIIGFIVNKLFPYLPKLIEFTKKIDPVISFFEKFSGNVLKGIINFIDFGYDAYDRVRSFTKSIGGEDFQKTFDDFSSNLNTFINLAIVAGMATMGGTDFTKKGDGGYASGYASGYAAGVASRGKGPRYRSPGQAAAGRTFQENLQRQSLTRERMLAPTGPRGPLDRVGRGFRGATAQLETGTLFKKGAGFQKSLYNTGKFVGKGGSKFASGATKMLGRVPIIGGLIDFIISTVIFREDPGRAAAKAVGSTIGSALGTFIPVPFVGTILGGILGDIVGGALYDTLTANKPKKMAVGGKVTTRKGQVVGGKIKRTVRKSYSSPPPRQIKPGSSVGGEKKIKSIFPEPPKNQIGKVMNPFGFLNDTAKQMGMIPFLGPIFNLFGKVLLGQIPDGTDYQIIGKGINAWINNAISKGILQGNLIQAFANGGMIGNDMMKDISGWVSSSVEELVKNKVTNAINDLRKNLGLKPLQEFSSGLDITDDAMELGSASDAIGGARLLMAAGFPPLAAAILAGNIQQESGWKGQRTPWVLNDGGGTNKGLMSWTSNSGRIANAEKFLGKPLETASNAEQIKWIKEELRQYGLLDEFMNPQATEKQLQDASYNYIKWGHLGDRWKYSKQIFAALQKGEQGTYQPPTSVQLGTEQGNLQLAKKIAESFGVPLYSYIRPNDPGYHGMGRAMDFSNDAVGRGTPEQMKLAKELVKKFGSTAKEIFYTPLGFSIKDGKKVSPIDPNNHYNHVHVAFEGGGLIGKKVKSIQSRASYDNQSESIVMIQPIIIEKKIPVSSQTQIPKSISFPRSGGVNIISNKSQLTIR
jgi:hypothetical protein